MTEHIMELAMLITGWVIAILAVVGLFFILPAVFFIGVGITIGLAAAAPPVLIASLILLPGRPRGKQGERTPAKPTAKGE